MNKTLTAFAVLSSIALASPAFSADETYKASTKIERSNDGDVTKKTSESLKGDAGNASVDTKTKVDVDSDGSAKKTVETKQVDDPKGLFNKTTVKTKDTVKHTKGGKLEHAHKKTVNGDTVEKTDTTANTVTTNATAQ